MNQLYKHLTLNQTYRESLKKTKDRLERDKDRATVLTILYMAHHKISCPEMEYHAQSGTAQSYLV